MTIADRAQEPAAATDRRLPGIEAHPHARALLLPAIEPGASPSHAYLFHGPAGTGKRTIARSFAAALLAEDPARVDATAERIERDSHPDLTWVRPSGASEMLVGDIEEPVVAAAARTPFESARRVFVIEAVDTMTEEAANRMLKTLEEPPAFVHLLLLTDRRDDVLETIASRCQAVRFDPLAPALVAERLERGGTERATALACARLALGDAGFAEHLASDAGETLRAGAESFICAVLAGATEERPWTALLGAAKASGERAGAHAEEQLAARLELVPAKERKREEREALVDRRRVERRERTRTLEQGLRLAELWLRDLLCLVEEAPELIHAVDRLSELEGLAELEGPGDVERPGEVESTDTRAHAGARVSIDRDYLHTAMELTTDTRLSLAQNVSEELALEALAYRLAIGPRSG